MNLIVFLIRGLSGFTFMILAWLSTDPTMAMHNPEWHPNGGTALGSLALGLLYWGPLFVDVMRRSLAVRMPTARSFTGRRFLIFGRWSMAYLLAIMTEECFLENQYDCSILMLIAVAALMPPLDRLLFAPRREMSQRLKEDPIFLKFLANLGAITAFFGAGYIAQKHYAAAIVTFTVSIGLLLLVPTVLLVRRGWNALSLKPIAAHPPVGQPSVAPPALVPRPSPDPQRGVLQDPASPKQSHSTPSQQRIQQRLPIKPGGRRKYYSAKAWYWNWPVPKEAQAYRLGERYFSLLIRGFETSWLESKDYYRRLALHRNPAEFIREIIAETEDYLQTIRRRRELLIRSKTMSFIVDTQRGVTDEVSRVWKADKRLRSLYRATQRFAQTPNKHSIVSFRSMAPHIAEYRAMVNVIKHLKHTLRRTPGQASVTEPGPALRAFLAQLQAPDAAPEPSIDQHYFEIIDYLIEVGKNLEHYPDLNKKHFDEQWYRNYFLPGLNTRNPSYSAKGEVYNSRGKTDILVLDTKGNNLLIAECKLWKGENYLREGVDQLLTRYVNWRDQNTALVIFNRDVKNFTALIATATKTLSDHPLCQQAGRQRTDCSWSYLFHHPDDKARVIRLELILLNFA